MSGRPSSANEQAKAAFEKSVAADKPLSVVDLAHKFKLSPSTIYRSQWWKDHAAKQEAK